MGLRSSLQIHRLEFLQDDERFGQFPDMGERDMKPGDAVFLAEVLHLSLYHQFWLPLLVVQDLDIDKAVAASPSGADGLEEGLFGGKPGGEMLGALGLRFTVGNLPGG